MGGCATTGKPSRSFVIATSADGIVYRERWPRAKQARVSRSQISFQSSRESAFAAARSKCFGSKWSRTQVSQLVRYLRATSLTECTKPAKRVPRLFDGTAAEELDDCSSRRACLSESNDDRALMTGAPRRRNTKSIAMAFNVSTAAIRCRCRDRGMYEYH